MAERPRIAPEKRRPPPEKPCLYVLAGTNGAGKSSVFGAMAIRCGTEFFNPDEATRAILDANPGATREEANGAAWLQGKRLLERAIAGRLNYMFETTLGGETLFGLLRGAPAKGLEVRMAYVGLATPDLHVARVAARVAKGGHDIPEAKIRERYDTGREHVIELLPSLAELKLYDNSADADPDAGRAPRPQLVLHVAGDRVVQMLDASQIPGWAKPIVAAALKR